LGGFSLKYEFINIYNNPLDIDTCLSKEIKKFYSFALNYYKKDLDKRTIYLFVRYVESFERFMFFQYPNITSINEISEKHIISFKDFCIDGLNNRKTTVNSKLTALRYFFKYLSEEGLIDYNFALNVSNFKIDGKLPTHFTTSQLKVLFSQMREFPYGIRDVVISKLVLTTGIEIQDILNLKLYDIDINNKLLTLPDHQYPLGDSIIVDLKNYLSIRNEINSKSSDFLFLSRVGTPYSIRSFQLLFKKAITYTDIPVDLSPRFLKMTFLYNMAKVVKEEELKTISNQNKVEQYYSLLKNPLQNII